VSLGIRNSGDEAARSVAPLQFLGKTPGGSASASQAQRDWRVELSAPAADWQPAGGPTASWWTTRTRTSTVPRLALGTVVAGAHAGEVAVVGIVAPPLATSGPWSRS